MPQFVPGAGYVLLEPAEFEQSKTKGGIALPETRKDVRLSCGKVLAVGPGHWMECGRRQEAWFKPGWEVLHTSHAAHTLYGSDGTKYVLIDQSEVVCQYTREG